MNAINFSPQTSIYIRNLPQNTTEDGLFAAFKAYGTVLGLQVKKEKDSIERLLGFVNFKSN